MSLKDALIASKLAGGGGNLPTPTAANYGDSLVVGKQSARGSVIVSEQTVTTEYDDPEEPEGGSSAPITGNPPFVDGNQYVVTVNGTDYIGTYLNNEITVKDPTNPDFFMIVIWREDSPWYFWTHDEAGDYTIKVSEVSYQYAYVTDPYAAYDVVIRLDNSSLRASTGGTVEKGDITAIEAKGLAGVPITVLIYAVRSDPDYPYTRTCSVVSCYWNNYDAAHDDHCLDMVIADCETWNAFITYRQLRLYTTGNLSFTNFKKKVDLAVLSV